MENALRQGQAEALAASASAIAAGVTAADLGRAIAPERFGAQRSPSLDIYAHPLRRRPVLDGFSDDWGLPSAVEERLSGNGFSIRYAAARDRGSVYLFIQVLDDDVVYGRPDRSDRVRLRVGSGGTGAEDLLFTTRAPGTLSAVTPAGERRTDVEASWQPTSTGYSVEIRLPAALAEDRLGFLVTDYRRDGNSAVLGTMPSLAAQPGWLVYRTDALDQALSRGAPPDSRLRIVDRFGFVLADTGPPSRTAVAESSRVLRRLVRVALGEDGGLPALPSQPADRLDMEPFAKALELGGTEGRFRSWDSGRATLISARVISLPGPPRALLIAEQDTNAILSATDQAATRLVAVSFMASLTAAVLLLTFAAWLSWRIRRLSSAASRALTGTGEIRARLPEADSPDELGTLSRDFSRLLTQVGEYNAYLKTLGQKLSHELRTPMAVVLTSLENLQANPNGADAERYLARAREGLVRLQAMVSALGAATRLEQALAGSDTERFDLAAMVGEMFGAYAETHPERRIDLDLPEHPCFMLGSPDLIAGLLDKLFENALDFCPPGGRISLRLDSHDQTARLRVANTGSRLPDALADRIFDSLVSARDGDGGPPHLGLGMYIARLIVRHHQGSIAARNLPEDKGVEFTVELPLEGTGSR
jgi:signal transduction histidine kinase